MTDAGFDGRTAYERWRDDEGIPVVGGLAVEDLNAIEVRAWPRMGALGAFVDLLGNEGENGAYVLEIAAGTSTTPERHLYEEMTYVLRGTGTTTVWAPDGQEVSVDWGPRSLFSVPPNREHRHTSTSPGGSRLLAVTTAATVLSLLHDPSFVFNSPADLGDRFHDPASYYRRAATRHGTFVWETNIVNDVGVFDLEVFGERGPGQHMSLEMGDNTLAAHISSFPVGTYKKAHRHPGGAHVVIVEGEGYSLMWPQGGPVEKIAWRAGSLIVPPGNWYHQHFNTGATPARYLAVRWGSRKFPYKMWLRREHAHRLGGWLPQIEFEDEDPAIRDGFEAALRDRGIQSRMTEVR